MTRKSLRLMSIGFAVVALLLGYGVGRFLQQGEAPVSRPSLGGDFTLQSAHGPISLADFRGQVVPIYFGYTFCPDACPMSLANLGMAIKRLSDDERKQVQPIFVSVDPGRDTPQRLADYVAHFSLRMLGLTGTAEEVAEVAKQYGVFYKLHKANEADSLYLVDHTSRTYLMDRDGKMIAPLPHATSVDEVAQALRNALH